MRVGNDWLESPPAHVGGRNSAHWLRLGWGCWMTCMSRASRREQRVAAQLYGDSRLLKGVAVRGEGDAAVKEQELTERSEPWREAAAQGSQTAQEV